MSRAFDDASSQYLRVTSCPISGYPFALVGWYNNDDLTAIDVVLGIGDATGTDYHALAVKGDGAGDPVEAYTYQGGSSGIAITTTGSTINTWHHAAGLFVAATDRRAFIDGGSKGTDATSKSSPTTDASAIGVTPDSTPAYHFSGLICECAIYDLSQWPGATDSDKANEFERVAVPSLAHGVSPIDIPLGLVAYWPELRTDQDLVGGYDMTAFNNPTWADHAPDVRYPIPVSGYRPALTSGEVCWGHDTAVLEANVRDFFNNWVGTGAIGNPAGGDNERLELETTEYMISEVIYTGALDVELEQNVYQAGDDVDLDYRHGATRAACLVAGWNNYAAPFTSLGFVQIRLTSTL